MSFITVFKWGWMLKSAQRIQQALDYSVVVIHCHVHIWSTPVTMTHTQDLLVKVSLSNPSSSYQRWTVRQPPSNLLCFIWNRRLVHVRDVFCWTKNVPLQHFCKVTWFSLNGNLKSQNNRHLCFKYAHTVHEFLTHNLSIKVWFAVNVHKITGPMLLDHNPKSYWCSQFKESTDKKHAQHISQQQPQKRNLASSW
jgi:hypothetical protein